MSIYKRMNRKFEIGQKVTVGMGTIPPIEFKGEILGKAIDSLVQMWIVSIEEPLNDYTRNLKEKAVVVQANWID